MLVNKISTKIAGENELDALIYVPDGHEQYPAVLMCHGFLSGKEEFGELPENIAKKGYVVMTFDFTGHGKSKGDRGYFRAISHIDDAERALKALLANVKVDQNRVAIVGHSMGTIATTRLVTESELGKKSKTCILLSPPRRFEDSLGKAELKAYEFASKIAWPVLLITGKHIYLPYKFSSKDIYLSKEAIEKADSLNFLQKSMSVNNYYYMIKQVDNEKFAGKVTLPTLVMVAKGDKLVANSTSRDVYNAIKGEPKKYVEIENSGHSMMMDYNKDKVEEEILAWFEQQL